MNADEYRTIYARVRAQIISAVPASERDIDALLAAAGADKPRTLRELDAYLGTGTDALFAADASCPAVIDRLTRIMSAAGLPVTPPGCGRCGQPKPLRHQRPQGRICDACARHDRRRPCANCGRIADIVVRRPEGGICKNCDLRDPSTFKQCDKCGRTRRVAVNRVSGLALCQQCLDLPEQPCARCGASAPVHARTADGPICKRCYGRGHLPTRECGVCGERRPIARPATDSHPDICAGCLSSLHGTCVECGHVGAGVLSRTGSFHCDGCREHTNRRCAFCGRTRPVTANWPAGPACSTCYVKVREQPGRCAACRRDKVLIGLDGSGQRVCGPCAGASVDYLCGRCGEPGRVYQDGLCFRCLVADELQAVLASGTGDVPAQLQPLVDALMSADKPRSVLVWLRRSRAVQLLKELAQTGDPISHETLDALPTGRDVSFLRWVLVDAAVLPERQEYLERLQPWIEQTLAGQPEAHSRILLPYLRWHVLHRARRRAQRRGTFTAMSAARIRGDVRVLVELLDQLAQQDLTLATLGQHHVDEWLASGPPGRRQALRSFLGWAAKRKLCATLIVTANRPGRPCSPATTRAPPNWNGAYSTTPCPSTYEPPEH